MFSAIELLMKRLSDANHLEVIHGAHTWIAGFEWNLPTSKKQVSIAQSNLNKPLPEDFATFLTEVSNGGTLFYDIKYGQWGFRIYSSSEIVEKQRVWQQSLSSIWQSSRFIAFAELFGEANVMLFDIERPNRDEDSFAVIESNAYDPFDHWLVASRSFHEWLDHLITAQGGKYWDWR
jgi:hypothetical protein